MKHSNREVNLLHELIEGCSFDKKRIHIKPLNELGYIVELDANLPARSDWVFYDLDDTVIASWHAKDKRLKRYLDHARSLGITYSDNCLLKLFKLTDEYARWTEVNKPIYHFHTHITLLSIILNLLEASSGHSEQYMHNKAEGVLQSHSKENPSSIPLDHIKMLEQIIFCDVITPDVYTDAAKSMTLLHKEGVGIGIFTYGEPYFQLLKSLELLQSSFEKPQVVSQIWLTKVPKGQFLRTAAATLRGSLLVIDDSPAELDDIHVNFHDQEARLHLVRSLRNGTKTVDHSWGMLHDNHTTFDARRRSPSDDLLLHIRQALSSLK